MDEPKSRAAQSLARKRWAGVTDEQKSEQMAQVRAARQQTTEDRIAIIARAREARAKWWAELSDEARAEYMAKTRRKKK